MSAVKDLQKIQSKNDSIICLGLDLDPKRMPLDYGATAKGMYDFVNRIIDVTRDLVCAYKPNLAFYESRGTEGLSLLKLIIDRVPDEIPVILDAKMGDTGSTAVHYAEAAFDYLNADWVTLNPYLGYDSLRPFIERKDRGIFVLCLTSNPGSRDLQMLKVDGKPIYEIVAEKVAYWNKENNCGIVVSATDPDQLKRVRDLAGEMPLLIPGVGAQSGSLEKAAAYGTADFTRPALINVSRSVLYASRQDDFPERARTALKRLNDIVRSVRKGGLPAGPPPIEKAEDQSPSSHQPSPDNAVSQETVPGE